MKAMIFAAGLGTRLQPLTDNTPKALIEVAGQTLLERVITRMDKAGFNEITINVHHHAQKIIDFLYQKDNFGLDIHISDERNQLLDTGGGILKARQWLEGDAPFLVHNVDILTDFDLATFYQHHLASGAMATVLVKQRQTQRYLLFDSSLRLRGWANRQTGQTLPPDVKSKYDKLYALAFGGIHMMSPAIFPVLEQHAAGRQVFPIIPFYIDKCQENTFLAYPQSPSYHWFDVGRLNTLQQANDWYAERQM